MSTAAKRRVAEYALGDSAYADVVAWRQQCQYKSIDAVLRAVDVSLFSDVFLIGLLTVTASCAVYLNDRADFFARVSAKVKRKRDLLGLECRDDGDAVSV